MFHMIVIGEKEQSFGIDVKTPDRVDLFGKRSEIPEGFVS